MESLEEYGFLIQCRTHHQKYELKLDSPKAILEAFKTEVGPNNFNKIVRNKSGQLVNYLTGFQPALQCPGTNLKYMPENHYLAQA